MIRLLFVLTALLFAGLAAPTQAATAIAYSEVENTYGWCAGYATSAAPGCAQEWCSNSGGTDCQIALVCDAGWNAVAFADTADANGFGAACDMQSSHDARMIALVRCIEQSRTLCWTNSTFNGSGEERTADENRTFDRTWYTQVLLHGLSYDPGTIDGAFGGKTRAAIRAFQADLGIGQTGELSDDLLYMLLTRNGGLGVLASDIDTIAKSFNTDEISRSYARSRTPLVDWTISKELAKRTTTVQRVMLAQLLVMNKMDCSIPARQATTDDAASGRWDVTCSNGRDYLIQFEDDEVYITDYAALPEPPTEPTPEPVPEPVVTPPPPPPQSDPGPAPSSRPIPGKTKG